METRSQLTVPKWPFFLADALLVLCAGLVFVFGGEERGAGNGALVVFLLFLGAVALLIPYVVEFCWQWQEAAANRDDEIEQQRLELAKTHEKIGERVRQLETLTETDSGSSEQVEEWLRAVRDAQERQTGKLARLAEELASLRTELGKKRVDDAEARAQFAARLEARAAQIEERAVAEKKEASLGAVSAGGSSGEAVLAPPEPAEETAAGAVEEPVAVAEEQAETGNETPATKPRRAAKPKVREETGASLFSTATVVATAFIGAGSKLYVRGSGPGLSWDEGVPMQFVEIGKWSWTTADADGPVELQIFKNDEEEDKAGILTLEPGQTLAVRPDFGG